MTDEMKDALDAIEFSDHLTEFRQAEGFAERVSVLKEIKAYIRGHFTPSDELAASRAEAPKVCVCEMGVPSEARQIVGIDQYTCAEHAFRGVFVLAGYVEKPSCCGACCEERAAPDSPGATAAGGGE